MLLQLQRGVHYPITVTELLKQPSDNVERFEKLFSYTFKTWRPEGDGLGGENQVQKTIYTDFESSIDGTLKSWKISKGQVITHR